MCYSRLAAFRLLLVLVSGLAIGCSDKTTEPHNTFQPADESHLWSKRFGDEDFQAGLAIFVDASENVIIAGVFKGTVDFGGGVLTSAGSGDVFVAKFRP